MQSKKTSGRDWTDPVQTVWTAVRTGLWRTLVTVGQRYLHMCQPMAWQRSIENP